MKQLSVERFAFGVKSSFGAKHNAATGLTLNAKRRALNFSCFISVVHSAGAPSATDETVLR